MGKKIDRRQFVQSTAAIGAGLFVAPSVLGVTASRKKKYDINVALIGAGAQGQVLFDAVTKIGLRSGIKFKAVCDIWENKNLKDFSQKLGKYSKVGYGNAAYTDYREMLDKEKGNIDAVIVASPDFRHAEHANACMEAGLDVYCEKEMSNTIEGARSMVETSRRTGKLLQIGHQRRSNPRYLACRNQIIEEADLLGQITTINGQWNRSVSACKDLGYPEGTAIPQDVLTKYGFKNMKQFRNWRWYKGLGGGPIVDLGSHQIDIYSWFLDNALPVSVMASGGVDYWTEHEWYDNVICVFEFKTKAGKTVRASYQTLTTNGSDGYYEKFMGDKGTLKISESGGIGSVFRPMSVHEEEWDKWINKGYMTKVEEVEKKATVGVADVRATGKPAEYKLTTTLADPFHMPHLVNFFDAVQDKNVKLNCPGEIGFETAVMVLKVNEAVEARKTLEFKKEEFHV